MKKLIHLNVAHAQGAEVTELKGNHTLFMPNEKAVMDVIESAAKAIK